MKPNCHTENRIIGILKGQQSELSAQVGLSAGSPE